MEAALHGDLRKRHLPGLHETDSSLKPKPQYELVQGDADRNAEQTCEMEGTDVRLSSERQQRHIVIKLRFDAHTDVALSGRRVRRVETFSVHAEALAGDEAGVAKCPPSRRRVLVMVSFIRRILCSISIDRSNAYLASAHGVFCPNKPSCRMSSAAS